MGRLILRAPVGAPAIAASGAAPRTPHSTLADMIMTG
jgi:hypothetical protein